MQVVVGVRDLKNRLSEYLRNVRAGEVVLITERGRVIAQLCLPPKYTVSGTESEWQALTRVAQSGMVQLASKDSSDGTQEALPEPSSDINLSAALAATRGDRE